MLPPPNKKEIPQAGMQAKVRCCPPLQLQVDSEMRQWTWDGLAASTTSLSPEYRQC